MKNQVFKFKQFDVVHGKSKMKVGTDGVLLGAWANTSTATNILDIGSGCGLIALMLAQSNSKAIIDAVESDRDSYEDMYANFRNAPWSARLNGYHTRIQDFSGNKKYDLIVSNPPYFNQGTVSPDLKRHNARHTHSLPHDELIQKVDALLTQEGIASFILPFQEYISFIEEVLKYGFFEFRKTLFKSKYINDVERVLFTISRVKRSPINSEVLIQYNENGEWSEAYKNLTRPYYLKL